MNAKFFRTNFFFGVFAVFVLFFLFFLFFSGAIRAQTRNIPPPPPAIALETYYPENPEYDRPYIAGVYYGVIYDYTQPNAMPYSYSNPYYRPQGDAPSYEQPYAPNYEQPYAHRYEQPYALSYEQSYVDPPAHYTPSQVAYDSGKSPVTAPAPPNGRYPVPPPASA